MTREEAWTLLCEYTKNESLKNHALAVEAAMKAYAKKYGEDEEKWSVTGLLHDFDYELYPQAPDHATKGAEILRQKGILEDIIKAILGHASYTGVPRDTQMAKVLFAVDELTGFLTACALVKPSKTIAEVEANSVRKKLKDKAFARSVNREDIQKGLEELGLPFEEHVSFVIEAMKGISKELGL